MKFNNLQALKEHPQASKIPDNVFRCFFSMGDFPDYLLSIMTADNTEIDEEIRKKSLHIKIRLNGRKQVWLAIAYSHPDMSNSRLLEIARSLSLNEQEILICASLYGNLPFFNYVTESLENFRDLIKTYNFGALRGAASGGNLPIIDRLIAELAPTEVENMIKASSFGAFREAARGGHLAVIERLISKLTPVEVQNMIKAQDFEAFRFAAGGGHLAVVDCLISKSTPVEVQNMIKADYFYAFGWAARGGHLPVIERLIQLAPTEAQNMIQFENFEAFSAAASGGHLAVIDRLIELVHPNEVQNMIQAYDFQAFGCAASGGHLAVIDRLIQLVPPNEVKDMIKGGHFEAFRAAACGGHRAVIERLIELDSDGIQNMIRAENFWIFRAAATAGHLRVIDCLTELASNEVKNMIKARDFEAFREAARGGHLAVIERLIQLDQAKVPNMIKARDFRAFREAASGGHLSVIERLIELAPANEVQNMIAASDFRAFREAASGGHLSVIERLIELAPANEVQNMIAAENFRAFREAARGGHRTVIERLLSYPIVLANAEIHVREYRSCVNPFIDKKLSSLRAQKSRLEQQAPNEVFDIIDPNEANLLFYVLRNLIRRNEAGLQDDILFLLNIPSVRSLAHTTNNELLRLALASHNQGAIGLLLNIPAVLQLARENEFYRDEARGGINLRELAQSRESSMTALSQGEQKRLARAIDHYKPKIEATGVTHIRETLATRYEAHPAIFIRQGQACILPLQWTAFQALELNQEERSAAMEAYAKHKDHTAWRYLSKPNPWMHPEAAYVNVNPATHERWSTFEEYQPVICLYYLAAIDRQFAPTDGYTLETRLEGFIDELALIGRAHNWDNTRFKTNMSGEPILDEDGEAIMEEYDDLEGDRPSCFSGVKRRLFQSVRGHPLLIILTKSIIDAELRGLFLSHLKESINPVNRSAILAAWDKITEGDKLTEDDIAVLTSLNISEEKQGQFIAYLTNKYQEQFIEDPSFLLQIKQSFFLKEKESHVHNFGYCMINFLEETGPQVPLSAVSIFKSQLSSDKNEPQAQEERHFKRQKLI